MRYFSAAQTASRLGVSKQWLLKKVRLGEVKPAPTKLEGTGGQWLFSGNSKITVDNRKHA